MDKDDVIREVSATMRIENMELTKEEITQLKKYQDSTFAEREKIRNEILEHLYVGR